MQSLNSAFSVSPTRPETSDISINDRKARFDQNNNLILSPVPRNIHEPAFDKFPFSEATSPKVQDKLQPFATIKELEAEFVKGP